MRAVVEGRDSLVVLPTGGGKSLCFQAPALAMPGLAVVVSPLISLMKDQVDALVDCGVRAACVNSTLTAAEKRADRGRDSRRAAEAALPLARAAADGAHARVSAAGAAVVHRHRRGPLHQRVGPRLPARVPRPARAEGALPQRRAARLHGHRHAARPRRHRPRAGPARAGGARRLVRPAESRLSRAPAQRLVASRSAKSSTGTRTSRASSTASAAPTSKRSRPISRRSATTPCPITPACRTTTAAATRTRFINDRAGSSWPPSPSAWASTSRTCGT